MELSTIMEFVDALTFGNRTYVSAIEFDHDAWAALRSRVYAIEMPCVDPEESRPHFIVSGVKIIRGSRRQ